MNNNDKKKGPRVVISGYYGYDNCGDEAVLMAIIHCLKTLRPDVRITVLSGNPPKTCELYNVKAVNRWNPFRIVPALLFCRLLISGGGSLLQDVTSVKSPRYYLMIINAAAFLRKRIMVYSQGVGPLSDGKNRKKVSKAMNRCHSITVRDGQSAELLRELGVKRDINVTCDPVMVLTSGDDDIALIDDELLKAGVRSDPADKKKPLLMAVIRQWKDDRHLAPVAELIERQAKRGWDVLLVPAHYPDDKPVLDAISNLMTEQPHRMDKCLSASEFLALAARADKVFSMRLHGLICAFAAGTSMLGLSYDPKVDAFMEQVGLGGYCLPFDGFDAEAAQSLLEETDDLSAAMLQALETHRDEMRKQAWATAKSAVELLEKH